MQDRKKMEILEDFIYLNFIIIESHISHGFVILFPIDTDLEVCNNLVEGVVNKRWKDR